MASSTRLRIFCDAETRWVQMFCSGRNSADSANLIALDRSGATGSGQRLRPDANDEHREDRQRQPVLRGLRLDGQAHRATAGDGGRGSHRGRGDAAARDRRNRAAARPDAGLLRSVRRTGAPREGGRRRRDRAPGRAKVVAADRDTLRLRGRHRYKVDRAAFTVVLVDGQRDQIRRVQRAARKVGAERPRPRRASSISSSSCAAVAAPGRSPRACAR